MYLIIHWSSVMAWVYHFEWNLDIYIMFWQQTKLLEFKVKKQKDALINKMKIINCPDYIHLWSCDINRSVREIQIKCILVDTPMRGYEEGVCAVAIVPYAIQGYSEISTHKNIPYKVYAIYKLQVTLREINNVRSYCRTTNAHITLMSKSMRYSSFWNGHQRLKINHKGKPVQYFIHKWQYFEGRLLTKFRNVYFFPSI